VDWQAARNEWIDQFRSELLPRITGDSRFADAHTMAERFEASVIQWRKSDAFRPVINNANELCAVDQILRQLTSADRLMYEPRLLGTSKSIDFCITQTEGTRRWIDMKTIAPGWQDDEAAWERITRIAADFPANSRLVLDRHFAGAALGGQMIKARWSFVQRATELEAKISLLTDQERGPVRLLLCSEGSWQEDDLEDFADFYRTGQFRADDWAQNAINRYMHERSISFNGSITGFCYLERRHEEVVARNFTVDVRGPAQFAVAAYAGDRP
jgi:hypothetical protein